MITGEIVSTSKVVFSTPIIKLMHGQGTLMSKGIAANRPKSPPKN